MTGTPAKIASSIAGRPSFVPGILMNRLGRPLARADLGCRQRAGGVMGQQRRHFQRYPAVHAVGLVVNRPEQIGGARKILERQLEEKRLTRLAFAKQLLRIAAS